MTSDNPMSERPRIRARQPGEVVLHSLPPLSLYVHVPWCVRKCPYCDFNSHELRSELPEQDYLDALEADLEQALPQIWGRQIVSVFIGGGTPSLLSGEAMDRMLGLFRAYLNLWPETEITLEANPGTAEAARFKEFASAGVNRLSIGIQSFNDDALKALDASTIPPRHVARSIWPNRRLTTSTWTSCLRFRNRHWRSAGLMSKQRCPTRLSTCRYTI